MSILKPIRERFFHQQPQADSSFQPGVRHYLRESDGAKNRLHLRVEADGYGLLLVNASRAFHLNPSAAFMADLALSETAVDQAARAITRHFKVSTSQARQDYAAFLDQFSELIDPNGACPICELELETTAPFSARPSAPYRMDLALTYRCNNDCAHCYNARPRNYPELSTDQWKTVLTRLWNIGIPHIVFTGGEPTLRADLPELIAQAERNGQITGINTNGRKLKDPAYLQRLVDAGLDHAQITFESHRSEIHDAMVKHHGAWEETLVGLKNALASKLFVMTNTTLLQANAPYLEEHLEYLAELGVPTVGLNALIYSGHGIEVGTGIPEADLQPLLEIARRVTGKHSQRLIWYTPTQYCHFDPIQMELGVKGCTAALYNMCIEPDGSVIPCQSYYQSLGNFLEAPWESIWNHPLAVDLRERKSVPIACQTCSMLPECGGGCPLARQTATPVPVPAAPGLSI
ncbi:MAG TPA: PqqD family peptide modification chaperone [Longilinea sp.]|nr:PqqD family peptide modification chaperone [Longilinea sp.]